MENFPILGTITEDIQNNLFDYLVDLNSPDTPKEILDKIIDIKKELGSFPLGSVKISENEWVVIDTSGQIYFKLIK